jgi:predicted chitinase
MDQELRDLVDQMRQLIPVLQSMNKDPGTAGAKSADNMTRGVDRIVVALGQLAVKLDTAKKTRRDEEEAVKKFANAVEKTANNIDEENKERQKVTDALEAESKAREAATKEATRRNNLSQQGREQEDKEKAKYEVEKRNKDTKLNIEQNRRSSSSSRELFDSLSSTGGSAEILKNKFLDLGGNSMAAQAGLQLFSAGLSGTAKSLTTFASGLINGQRGAELSAKAVSDFAKPVLNAASAIGTLLTLLSFIPGPAGLVARGFKLATGAALGLGAAAGKAALSLNELAAKQIDAQFKSFNALSQSGIRLQDGFIGVIDTMQTLGMTMSEVEQFNQLIGENNRSLAIMGGTATKGAKQFSEVAGQLVKGELGKQLEYMGVTQEEQRKATLSYMSIQARTGQLELNNTNKLIEGSANFIRELDLAAQMAGTTRKAQMEAREAALTETRFRAAESMARKRGDVEEIKRLERGKAIASMMRDTLGQEAFIAALQATASGGALVNEGVTALEVSTGFTQVLNDTNLSVEQAFRQIVKQGVDFADGLGDTNALLGDIKGFQIASVPLRDEEARQLRLKQAAADQGFTGPEGVDKFMELVKNNQLNVSKETRDLINANRAQQAATQTMERGLSEFNAAVVIHNAASETFAKAVKMFGDAVGLKVPGGTTTFGGVPVESGVRLPPTVEAATVKVEQAKDTIKELDVKIKEQEEKLKLAKTNVEKDQAEAEIKKLKSQLSDANNAKNAAELGKKSVENKTRMKEAHERLKGPVSIDPKMIESLSTGGITDKRAQANILAQIQAESGGVAKSENMNYSPERLMQVFPKKFANIQEASQVAAKGPEAIGERVYGGRMGNTVAGEGFKYRGRGLIQITGKDNYKKFGDIIGVDLVQNPDLANNPEIARKLAVAYFQDKQKSGVDLTKSREVSKAMGHVDIMGDQSMQRETLSQKILEQMPKARDGGTFRGPMSGYPAVLHGTEAVIPLKNGAVPVMMPALDELVSSNRAVDAQVQVLRNEMGSMMRELTNALVAMKESGSQERMIQLLESMNRSQQTTATASQRMAQLAAN